MTKKNRTFGEIPGFPPGSSFVDRIECSVARVHCPREAGISGGQFEGVDSIVASGGYRDDEDFGEEIIYTGHGGQDRKTKRQIADQTLTKQNAAFVINESLGLPIRVIRGSKGDPTYSPHAGFRYDGLFKVEEHWQARGLDGFLIWRFRLKRLDVNETPASALAPSDLPEGNPSPGSRVGTVTRTIRDTNVTQFVKQLYKHKCQICGTRLDAPVVAISEGAHIQALSKPHSGPDIIGNVLCLCPNHHAMLDKGALFIKEDLSVWSFDGKKIGLLNVSAKHAVGKQYLQHHRARFGFE